MGFRGCWKRTVAKLPTATTATCSESIATKASRSLELKIIVDFTEKPDKLISVMREIMNIFYRPEIHNGVINKNNDLHSYRIELDESFENRSNNEKFAGIGGTCTETGKYKRFRMDRLEGMFPVEN